MEENPDRSLTFLETYFEQRKVVWFRTLDSVWWSSASAGYEWTQRDLGKKLRNVKGLAELASWVRMRLSERASAIVETTKEKLKKIKDQLDPRKAIKDLMQDWIEKRSLLIASTETHWAVETGSIQAALDTGATKKIWITFRDERVRHTHAAQDDMELPVDQTFPNGCRYPGDPSAPLAETISCRCFLEHYL